MTTHDRDKVLTAAKEAGFSEVKSRPSDADVRKGYRLSGEFKGWKASPTQLEAFYAIAFEDGRQAEREDSIICDAEPAMYLYPPTGATLHPSRIEDCRKVTWVPLYRARGDNK